jgi:energy-coupling factor transport system permease protein
LLVSTLLLTRAVPQFLKLLRRTRWLLVSLAVVYTLTTPGVLLIPSLNHFSPSQEGLETGGLQAWRMAILLGGLALLHHFCNRERLLNGLYHLMAPLRAAGAEPQRIAGRLWLTLYYAENARTFGREEWHRLLHNPALRQPTEETIEWITLEHATFRFKDHAALLLVIGLLGGLGVVC